MIELLKGLVVLIVALAVLRSLAKDDREYKELEKAEREPGYPLDFRTWL